MFRSAPPPRASPQAAVADDHLRSAWRIKMGKTKALAAVKECLGLPEDAQSMQILNAAGRTQVVDMFGDDKLSAKIQIRPMGQLLRGVDQMLVVRYTWDDDSPMWRELSCAFAIAIAKDKRPQQMYHLLGNNCEQFATFCRTFR